jgi:hypothetical protein
VGCLSHEEPIFDEEDKGLAFDIEPISDGLYVDGLTTMCISYDEDPNVNEGPLFDKEFGHEEEELSTNTELILSFIITAVATMTVDVWFSDTTIDASLKCLMKCLGNGRRGCHMEHFHEGLVILIHDPGDTIAPKMEMRSVIFDLMEAAGFEYKF